MLKTVLIAESNDIFLEALAGTFSLLGYTVVGKTNRGSEGLTLARKVKPDLLLFDLGLLNGNAGGMAELKALKEQFPGLKILVLGSHEGVDDVMEHIVNAGFDGYWNKFGDRNTLLDALKFQSP